ncbi:MAG TPA: heme-copper oxidase subunit III [Dehalococcoidia bacterium]|nr:heme-copper oxidase subunit III [Dehalococcoidia bacterium]
MQHAASADHALETSTGLDNRKLMMWLFLASECLFFGGFIAAYLIYRNKSLTGPYPEDLYDIPFTSVSSFILIMSSVSMVLALSAIQRGDVRGLRVWLLTTALLGLTFLSGQAFEFTEFYHEGLTLETNLFGSTFFVLTGFHGAHVSVGVLILMSLFIMSWRGRVTPENSLNVELAGLYWHFVDVVWIVIFTFVYLIQT